MLPHSQLIWVLMQTNVGLHLPTSIFWFIAGVIFSALEIFLSKSLSKNYKFVPLFIGISCFILSFILWRTYAFRQDFNLQIIYWMGLSFVFVIWVRPMLIKGKKTVIRDAAEASTTTDILPGKTGKVLYEGCLWQARCDDRSLRITANQRVYVLRLEGNTLIVVPEHLFQL